VYSVLSSDCSQKTNTLFCYAMQLFVYCVQCNDTRCRSKLLVVFVAACIVSNHLPCVCEHEIPEDSVEADTENTAPTLGILLSVFGIFRYCKYRRWYRYRYRYFKISDVG